MAQPRPPSPWHGHTRPEPYRRKQPYERRRNGGVYGLQSGLQSGFGTVYSVKRDSGHLDARTIESSLLPSQKKVLAMSRAQYLASLGDPTAKQAVSVEQQTQGEASGPADKLSVGVCVFRLDGATLSPAVLLLRRSPAWWRAHVFSSAVGRQGAGEWELPGGKVAHDDFCISTAVERLVREQTGLRVIKIMGMLSEVRWRAELKVLLWEEGGGVLRGADEDDRREDESSGNGDTVAIRVLMESNVGSDTDQATDVQSSGDGPHYRNGNSSINNTNTGGGNAISGSEGESASPCSLELKTLGIRIPRDSSSPSSSPPSLTSGYWSRFIPAPAPPPKDNPSKDHTKRHGQVYDKGGYGNDYDGDDENDYTDAYISDSDHDPALEPAPLSLPGREGDKALGRSRTEESSTTTTTLLGSALSLQPSARSSRRNAAVIPYKIVRREHVQLNLVVLVDEEPGDEEPLPRFLMHCVGDAGDRRKGTKGGDEIFEHDALEWATCARVEKLPMSEDLRRVVLEGLDWMGGLVGGFF
ncbi:hypothetical protein F5Y10DRAFT_110332 [Nemania abortiva]|nr:hypothetical protein F5Y10DRAFT_110332 [Nemania abortiva]